MIMVCDNCGHRVVKVQLGDTMITRHYGSFAKLKCNIVLCECDKPQ